MSGRPSPISASRPPQNLQQVGAQGHRRRVGPQRVSALEEQAVRAARKGGADVTYDVLSKTGAIAAATAPSNKKPSAAFASRSRKSTEVKLDSDGTAPGMYDAYSSTSMMGQASKSFNRSINAGKGGFGTSASRDTSALIAAAAAEYTPGPGAYASTSDASFQQECALGRRSRRREHAHSWRTRRTTGVGDATPPHDRDGGRASSSVELRRQALRTPAEVEAICREAVDVTGRATVRLLHGTSRRHVGGPHRGRYRRLSTLL